MSNYTPSARTITHQGRSLRLSLPYNDCRDSGEERRNSIKDDLQALDIETELATLTQTVEIFPDTADVNDMRVICSVADRVQWDQRLRQVRERKLQKMGVGAVTNVAYNAPVVLAKPGRSVSSELPLWTGLHTPAISTDSALGSHSSLNGRIRNQSFSAAGAANAKMPASIDSLAAQIATLQARHHQISKSVSEIVSTQEHGHERKLSQRDLVHRRLSSIAPMIVRNPSRVTSSIAPIAEEAEDSHASSAADVEGASPELCSAPSSLTTNPFKLHQHLLSNDMSELIRAQPVFSLPNFDEKYESFNWADEPIAETFNPFYAPIHNPYDTLANAFDGSLVQNDRPRDQLFFYPQESTGSFSSQFAGELHEMPGRLVRGSHVPSRPSLNTHAEEFIPFLQAVVRPSPESHAIPIIRPPEAQDHDEGSDSGVEIDATFETESNQPTEAIVCDTGDAYHGFDSGSDDSSDDEEEGTLEEDHAITYQSPDNNDERVKSFKFPSPEKHICATPVRTRTSLLNSPSPEERMRRLGTTDLPPPKMASTPKKSPSIFSKTISIEDEELDSIIMNLSIREHEGPKPETESESDSDSSLSGCSSMQSEGHPVTERPTLRRVPSTKLLLSHQDADMGLLLDAMLSTKLASITEFMSGLQSSVTSIEEQMKAMSLALQTRQSSATQLSLLSSVDKDEDDNRQSDADPTTLQHKIFQLECARAHDMATASQLRQELWNATSELEALKNTISEQTIYAKAIPEQANQSEATSERLRIVEAAKVVLQKAVGELTTKASRLEGRLLESTTFCSALQSQYSAAELSLAKLRKELNEVQTSKDNALANSILIEEQYELLKDDMQIAAKEIAQEQSRWLESDRVKDARIEELSQKLRNPSGQDELSSGRRGSAASITQDSRMTQYLMDRVKALEHANQHLQAVHREELQSRSLKYDSLRTKWQETTIKLNSSEATVDNLRAELVMSTEFGDRMMEDLQRSNKIIDTLSAQLRSTAPVSILKRTRSDFELTNNRTSEQTLLKLMSSMLEKDQRISELEKMLTTPPESTERQILTAVTDNILSFSPAKGAEGIPQDAAEVAPSLSDRVKELKRMRISWEAKAPALLQLADV